MDDLRTARRFFWSFLVLLVGSGFLRFPAATAPLPSSLVALFYVLDISCVTSVVFGMSYGFVDKKTSFQKRSEMLLLNVLPVEISSILQGEHRTIADQYDDASILCADLVQFTPMAQSMSPMSVQESAEL